MLRANAGYRQPQLSLPMVTSIDEVDEAQRLIERTRREVEEWWVRSREPRIGIMLEVPSMV
ncbi:putative PEP-binding protein [Shigella flexneri]